MADVIQNKLFEQKLTLKKHDGVNEGNCNEGNETLNHRYAVCLVNIKAMGVRTFSYEIPLHFQNKIKIGQALLVPFGRQGMINAFCVGFSDYLPPEIKAKPITKILEETPLFSAEYLKLLEWVANYYCTDLITVLNAAIPLKLIEKSLKTELSVEYVRDFGATKRQLQILELLKSKGKMSLINFEKLAKTTRATIKKLEALGCVRVCEEEIYRNPLDILNIDKTEPLNELSQLQQEVYDKIKADIKSSTQQENSSSPGFAGTSSSRAENLNRSTFLIHGVTASGKTEVYFKLIDDTIKSGKNVLFLAPEIALASQLTKRLARKFGTKDVAIWHSSISEGERYDVWQKLYKNEIKILAGARSAVFAPLQNIGLIIIDEEHESAYKQSTPAPRYDARLVAKKLAGLNNCPLILGSATPDISSYYYAVNSGHLYQMLKRYNNAKVAPVSVINMQEYGQAAYKHLISQPLIQAIKKTLYNMQQVILLINRRGYSTYTQCQGCGHVIECPNCAIPMIWHSKDNMLKCHYCNHVQYFPDKCPNCGFEGLKNSGTGTQKIEEYIAEIFQGYNIARIDSDVLTRKGEHIRLLEKFQKGEIDILVGTQMIAKGLDNPNVTLVGVISADASFNLPDYRASERGFQLLTQVAGRAGRGEFKGRVFFQTYNPEYYALESAKSQNYADFYKKEIVSREDFDYPPFSQIIRIIMNSENKFRAEKSAQEIALRLHTMIDKFGFSERLDVLGPTPCVIERLNSRWRFQILIKNKLEDKGHQFVSSFLNKINVPKDIRMSIDVDPLDIL
ncbi:primosomal protein N' [bacterium]|nr:primosomal protein N' [bacterium]